MTSNTPAATTVPEEEEQQENLTKRTRSGTATTTTAAAPHVQEEEPNDTTSPNVPDSSRSSSLNGTALLIDSQPTPQSRPTHHLPPTNDQENEDTDNDDDDDKPDDEPMIAASSSSGGGGGAPVARCITDAELEAEIGQRLLQRAVQAEVVQHLRDDDNDRDDDAHGQFYPCRKKRLVVDLVCFVMAAVVAIVLGLTLRNRNQDDTNTNTAKGPLGGGGNPPPLDTVSTLQLIQERQLVLCGVQLPTPGLSAPSSGGKVQGLLADVCRAMAHVVLQDATRVEFVPVGIPNRFSKLENREIDVLAEATTVTLERSIRLPIADRGLSFATPYYYSGLGFAGRLESIACIDNTTNVSDIDECPTNLSVCTVQNVAVIRDYLPTATIVTQNSMGQCIQQLIKGTVQVVVGEVLLDLSLETFRNAGYQEDVAYSSSLLSRNPLAIATRSTVDTEWSQLVHSVMDLLYVAEGLGLTQAMAQQALASDDRTSLGSLLDDGLDEVLADRLLYAVAAGGHYGELYERSMQALFPRGGLNALHTTDDNTGLLYSFPLTGSSPDRPDANQVDP